MSTAIENGFIGPDAEAMRERDNRPCTSCNHKNVSHGSHVKGIFVGIGLGPCGYCDCKRFGGPPAYENLSERFTATKELTREEALEAAQMTPNNLWTAVEGDGCDCDHSEEGCSCPENEEYASPGYHYVNAVQWFLTAEEWRDQDLHLNFIFDGLGH